MPDFAAHARAMRVLEAHLARRREDPTETREALLARHPDLAEILTAMLDEGVAPENEPPPLPVWRGLPGEGDRVGGYRIEGPLGQGGMGIVFRAHDEKLNRRIALKLVRPERLGSSVARERFTREAKLVARLEHPGICTVHDVGEVNGMPYMAMRLLEGESLAARIARGPLPRDEALRVLEAVARAVHYAHERGVVHRDLKPANIVLGTDGAPIVLDFGMARADDDADRTLTMTGELAGTPLYMAPEQIRGKGRVDARADVFALGVTLYEALTGRRPFAGQSLRELEDAILASDPVPPSVLVAGLGRDGDTVLAKALEKGREQRYASAAAFADDLARLRRREPVLARRPGVATRLARWAQRNPLALAVILVSTLAVITTAWLYVRGETARRDFRLVSLVPRLEELVADEAGLYGRWPTHGEAMRAWLDRADDLLAARPDVEAALARLAGRPAPEDRFLARTLAQVVKDLARLDAGGSGLATRVREHLEWIGRERELTLVAESAAWERACAEIAADPRYEGERIPPQLGLVPLGKGAEHGWQEFHHLRSGAPPRRGDGGRLQVGDDTGIVFVLVPRGTFMLGSSATPGEGNHDPESRKEETPAHAITLDAYFVAKHELTQGQWLRLSGGANPANARPDAGWRVPLSLAHPVESVPWRECTSVLAPFGLELPTEAQWERACRAGTTTPWWTGADRLSMHGRANLADRAARAAGLKWSQIDDTLDDGFPIHAPVDTLTPNPLGLHHVTGNVWEWCRDEYLPYTTGTAPGTGLREGKGDGQRVARGGAFDGTLAHARSALRRRVDPATRDFGLGVRAVRRVHR